MEPKIIYEDKSVLVLDKPSGWIVNESKTTGATPVVQNWLKENFDYEIVGSREERSGIVHRLDKETSGVLLVAKTDKAFNNLQAQFKSREVKKVYVALVHGKLELSEGEIQAPVGRLPWNRERFGVLPGGREATTTFVVKSKYQNPKSKDQYSLLELYPKTGRTHQIRIHLKYVGHPIVSDTFYAGRKTSRADKKWCPRLFLHASKISFNYPETGKLVEVESNIPSDLAKSLASLEKLSQTP